MNLFDLLIIIVFIIAIIIGLRRGIVVQLGSVGGIIIGIIACRLFAKDLAAVFAGSNPDSNDAYVSGIFANVIIFLIGYLLARVIAHFIKSATHALKLGIIDRLAGALFSLVEWFFLLSLALNLWQAFRPESNITASSRLADGRAAAAVIDFAPTLLGSETADSLFRAIESVGN